MYANSIILHQNNNFIVTSKMTSETYVTWVKNGNTIVTQIQVGNLC